MAEKFCTFLLDGHLFGVPVENVQEVLRSQRVTAVPLAPRVGGRAIRALTDWGGRYQEWLERC